MRAISRLAAAATMAVTLAAGVATTASAGTTPHASVHLTGGTTRVITAPGIAKALIENGIAPIALSPGRESLLFRGGSPTVRFAFPITGGQVSLKPLGGTVDHSGGILFADLKTGKQVAVSDFTIDLTHGDLTGILNGNPKARAELFTLNLAHAKLTARGHVVNASGIGLTLTSGAASALDSALGTSLFTGGLGLGNANTTLHY